VSKILIALDVKCFTAICNVGVLNANAGFLCLRKLSFRRYSDSSTRTDLTP